MRPCLRCSAVLEREPLSDPDVIPLNRMLVCPGCGERYDERIVEATSGEIWDALRLEGVAHLEDGSTIRIILETRPLQVVRTPVAI